MPIHVAFQRFMWFIEFFFQIRRFCWQCVKQFFKNLVEEMACKIKHEVVNGHSCWEWKTSCTTCARVDQLLHWGWSSHMYQGTFISNGYIFTPYGLGLMSLSPAPHEECGRAHPGGGPYRGRGFTSLPEISSGKPCSSTSEAQDLCIVGMSSVHFGFGQLNQH